MWWEGEMFEIGVEGSARGSKRGRRQDAAYA